MTEQLTLDDAPNVRESDPDTSRAAAHQIITTQNADCMAVLRVLVELGAANAFEVWRALDGPARRWKENVVGKRISSLKDNGYARDTGQRRRGSTTREQIVWAATGLGVSTVEQEAA